MPDIQPAEVVVGSQFNGASSSISQRLLAAQTHPRRTELRQRFMRDALEAGQSYVRAQLHSYHLTTPFVLGLKMLGTHLPEDAERFIEETIVLTANNNRNVVSDMMARNMIRPLPDIGVFTDTWERATDLDDAWVGMNYRTGPPKDALEFTTAGVPIPVIQKRWGMDLRMLLALQRDGRSIDATHAAAAARKIAEKEEDLVINGATLQYDGYTLYGLRTHPARITSVSGSDFGTPANVFTVASAAVAAMRNENTIGGSPIHLYLNPVQFGQTLADHNSSAGNLSAHDRALQIPELTAIRSNPAVPAGEGVFVVMDPAQIDLAIALIVTTVPWVVDGNAGFEWRIFSSMAPRIKADVNNKVGIVHVTGI